MTDSTFTEPIVGLALGSGAARGAAHVGVLEVLEEAGIECSVVAGSSAGALIGAAYAAGLTSAEVGRLVRGARWRDFGKLVGAPRRGLLDTGPLQQAIDGYLGPLKIEDLPRRFAAVAYDLRRRERVLLTTGSLSAALRASTAVPGLFPPVEIGGRLLIDGGIVEPVPVAAAMSLGADRVIAVSVGRSDGADNDLGHFLNAAAFAVLRIEPVTYPAAGDHVLVKPATDGLARWSTRDVSKLVEAGRRAAGASLDSLRRITL